MGETKHLIDFAAHPSSNLLEFLIKSHLYYLRSTFIQSNNLCQERTITNWVTIKYTTPSDGQVSGSAFEVTRLKPCVDSAESLTGLRANDLYSWIILYEYVWYFYVCCCYIKFWCWNLQNYDTWFKNTVCLKISKDDSDC